MGFESVQYFSRLGLKSKYLVIVLFLIALTARLYFIFFVSNPEYPGGGQYMDSYAHWRIAYMTMVNNHRKNPLELYDFNGMQYFWSLMAPILTIAAFEVTGSIDLTVERSLTALLGSLSVVLIFLLAKRFWNTKVAITAAIFAALNPIGIFNDSSGMVEPIGIFFLLLAVYSWPKKTWLAGLSLAFSLMSRAENWLIAPIILVSMLLFGQSKNKFAKIGLVLGFLLPVILYLIYLKVNTGNPIYPLYNNYILNIYGAWNPKESLVYPTILIRYLFLAILLISIIAALFVIIKRPKGIFLHILGLVDLMYLGYMYGVSTYGNFLTFVSLFQRLMIFAYAFIGLLISIVLFYKESVAKRKYLIFICLFAASQLAWIPLMKDYKKEIFFWQQALTTGRDIAKYYNGGGIVVIGDTRPDISYALIRYAGINGNNIVSDMSDPYFITGINPYEDWENYKQQVKAWTKQNNIKVIAINKKYAGRYTKISEEEAYFSYLTYISESDLMIFKISQ